MFQHWKRNLAVTCVMAFVVLSSIAVVRHYTASFYGSGWETSAGFNKVHVVSTKWSGSAVDITAVGSGGRAVSWSPENVRIDVNGGEKVGVSPVGAPDIQYSKGSGVRHVIQGLSGLETASASESNKEYSKMVGNTTYFYEWHMYAFDFEARTMSEVVNEPVGAHEGTVAGSYGKAVSSWVYVRFTIQPWDILGATAGKTFDDGNGNKLRLVDGWAGIMSARTVSMTKGIVAGTDLSLTSTDFMAGHCTGNPTANQGLAMENPITGKEISAYEYTSPSALKGVPQQVDIEIPTGELMAGSHSDYWIGRSNIIAVEYNLELTIVVDVLQVKGYQLVVGQMPAKSPDIDVNEGNKYTNLFDVFMNGLFDTIMRFVWIIVVIVVVAVGAILALNFARRRGRHR